MASVVPKASAAPATRLPGTSVSPVGATCDVGAAGEAGATREAALRTYRSNLAALYQVDPLLAGELERIPFADLPELHAARDGSVTARVSADDSQPLWLHSRYEPQREAAALLDALPASGPPNHVLLGFGLGYHALAIHERATSAVALVFEPDLPLLKAALCVSDVSAFLRSGRLLIFTRAEKSGLHERLMPWSGELLLGVHVVTLPYSGRRNAAEFSRFRKLFAEFMEFARLQLVTLLKVSRTTFRNVACNLRHYAANPGIESLAGRCAGHPAIILAAGPSLAAHLDAALALRERAVLIAVQTVFKMIRSRGALPHFVTSLDFHDVSAEFFEGIRAAEDCLLLAEPKVAPAVPDLFPERRILLTHSLYPRLLRNSAPRRGGLKAGSTVAHLAFYLALHLGCDPIIFVGQDLCFADGLFYPPGTPIEDLWAPELGRFQTLEMKHWERVVRNRPILRSVRDRAGRPALSDNLLLHYAEHFEADFATSPARVILAGSAGIPLAGAESMPLAEAAERYCQRALPAGWMTLPAAEAPDAAALERELVARVEETHRARRIAVEMQALLTELTRLVERPAEFNRRLVRVDELRMQMIALDEVYSLITDVSQSAELRRHRADRQMSADEDSPRAARARLERDAEFVREFVDGCDFVLDALPAAIARLAELRR